MKSFSITDIGIKRKVNQDYVFCADKQVGGLSNLFIVADGMGGHNAGDYASRFSVKEFVEQIKQSKETTPIKTTISNGSVIAKIPNKNAMIPRINVNTDPHLDKPSP